jgi:hypothetical protein
MSILELKQAISLLNRREREEVYAHLVCLKHNTPEWKRTTARRIRAIKAGKGVTPEALEIRLSPQGKKRQRTAAVQDAPR